MSRKPIDPRVRLPPGYGDKINRDIERLRVADPSDAPPAPKPTKPAEPAITGSLTAIETADTVMATGIGGVLGTLTADEADDAAAVSSTVAWSGTLTATEATDTATASGNVTEPQHGSSALVAAVMDRLKAGHVPGRGGNETWDTFCDQVRKSCGAGREDRAYGDRTIRRIVQDIGDIKIKQDK